MIWHLIHTLLMSHYFGRVLVVVHGVRWRVCGVGFEVVAGRHVGVDVVQHGVTFVGHPIEPLRCAAWPLSR